MVDSHHNNKYSIDTLLHVDYNYKHLFTLRQYGRKFTWGWANCRFNIEVWTKLCRFKMAAMRWFARMPPERMRAPKDCCQTSCVTGSNPSILFHLFLSFPSHWKPHLPTCRITSPSKFWNLKCSNFNKSEEPFYSQTSRGLLILLRY